MIVTLYPRLSLLRGNITCYNFLVCPYCNRLVKYVDKNDIKCKWCGKIITITDVKYEIDTTIAQYAFDNGYMMISNKKWVYHNKLKNTKKIKNPVYDLLKNKK